MGLQVWGTIGAAAEEQFLKAPVSRLAPGSWIFSSLRRSHPSEHAGNKTGCSRLNDAFSNYVDFLAERLETQGAQGLQGE